MPLPPTAVAYRRVSTSEQKDTGISLETQRDAINAYCAQRGLIPGPDFHDVESGTKDDRADYQAMLTYLRSEAKAHPHVVVIFRVDRSGRHAAESLRARDELAALKVPVHSVTEGGELTDVHWGMLAVFAQQQSHAIGDNVARTIARLRQNGWYSPTRKPWGYTYRPPTPDERAAGAPGSVLIPEPTEVPFVRDAFQRFMDLTGSYRSVARHIADLPSSAKGRRTMSAASVRLLLRCPTYIGQQPDGTPGRRQPIIDLATWDAVQAKIAGTATAPPRQATHRYLLSGFLRCPKCAAQGVNSRLAPTTLGTKTTKSPRYRCNAEWNLNRFGCHFSVSCRLLDAQVLHFLAPICRDAETVLRAEHARLADPTNVAAELAGDPRAQQLAELEAIRARAESDIANLVRLYSRGEHNHGISEADYRSGVAAARKEHDQADAAIAALHAKPARQLPPADALAKQARPWRHLLTLPYIAEQRDIISRLLVSLIPEPDPEAPRGQYRFHPTWTLLGAYVYDLMHPRTKPGAADAG